MIITSELMIHYALFILVINLYVVALRSPPKRTKKNLIIIDSELSHSASTITY